MTGKVLKWIPAGAALAAAGVILFSHTDKVNHTWFWAATLLILAAVLWVIRDESRVRFEKRIAIATAVLTVLLLVLLSVKELIGYPVTEVVFWQVLLLIVLIPACFYVVYCVLEWFSSSVKEREAGSLAWLRMLLVAEGLCFLFANFPFRNSADSANVYASILSRTFSDWHTISYQLYVWGCMTIGAIFGQFHPFAPCLVQTVLWFAIFFRVGTVLNKLYGSKAEKAWLILNAVLYIPMMYLGIMYKDVLFSMCLLAFCGELLYLVSQEKTDKVNVVFLIVFAIGSSLFRHGMVAVVAVTLIVLGIYFFRKRKQDSEVGKPLKLCCVMLACSLLAFLGMQGIGNYILHMEKNPAYIKYTVPLYVCGNIASVHPELLEEEDKELLEELMPLEKWREAYESNTYWADTVSREWGTVGEEIRKVDNAYGMKIVGLNGKILLRNPGAFFNAVTRVSSIVWQIARPQDGYEWSSAGYYWRRDDPDGNPALISADTGIKEVLEKIEMAMADLPVVSSIYFRGGIWVFLLAVIWAVLILKKKARLLIVFLPPVLIVGMLMLSCPSQDPRFVLPMMETGMMGIIAAKFA